MDDVDLSILRILSENGRAPYEVIAQSVGLTGNAVRKRVQSMMRKGVIERFCLCINPAVLGCIVIIAIFEHEEKTDIFTEFKKIENVMFIVDSINGVGAVVFLFKEGDEWRERVGSIFKAVESTKLISAFIYPTPAPDVKLGKIDWKIMKSLKDDLRKPVMEIASELKVSTKTVKRHLDVLIDRDVIGCTTLVQAMMVEGVIPYYLVIEFESDTDTSKLMDFGERFGKYWFKQRIQDLPVFLLQLYASTFKEVEDNIRFLHRARGIKNAIFFYPSRIYFSDQYLGGGLKDGL